MLPYATGKMANTIPRFTVVTTLVDGYFLVPCVTMHPLPKSDPTDLLFIFFYAFYINWTVQSLSA